MNNPSKYVIVVEHDLSILEFMSKFVCTLYGTPGSYGVITFPSGVREGVNIFLNGFIPSENLRFRDTGKHMLAIHTISPYRNKSKTEERLRCWHFFERFSALTFKTSAEETEEQGEVAHHCHYEFPSMKKTLGNFQLEVKGGEFSDSEIIVLLGQNGTGKST